MTASKWFTVVVAAVVLVLGINEAFHRHRKDKEGYSQWLKETTASSVRGMRESDSVVIYVDICGHRFHGVDETRIILWEAQKVTGLQIADAQPLFRDHPYGLRIKFGGHK
ncbi:MAG: hypothetical protein Q8R08_01935 [bacterium]|nr:hypothetical protein [bacterium]